MDGMVKPAPVFCSTSDN